MTDQAKAVYIGHWAEAPASVIDLAKEVIDKYHSNLKPCRIGFLFRDEAPNSKGYLTFGKCQKVNERMQNFVDLDFIIWLAEDKWIQMDDATREALIDHELCHIGFDILSGWYIRHHDFEEFVEIVKRHGFWNNPLFQIEQIAKGQQLSMDLGESRGKVVSVEVKQFAGLPE